MCRILESRDRSIEFLSDPGMFARDLRRRPNRALFEESGLKFSERRPGSERGGDRVLALNPNR